MQGYSSEETAAMYGMSKKAVELARRRVSLYWGGGILSMKKEIMLDLLTRLEELELHLAAQNGHFKAQRQVAGGDLYKHPDPVVLNARRKKVGMRAI